MNFSTRENNFTAADKNILMKITNIFTAVS